MKRRLLRLSAAVAGTMALLLPIAPHAEAVDVGNGVGLGALVGDLAATPGYDVTDPQATEDRTYTATGIMPGVFDGIPFVVNCNFTGSASNDSVIQGTATLQGGCFGEVPGIIRVTVTCSASASGSYSITITRVTAAAAVTASCRIEIDVAGIIIITCDITAAGGAAFVADTLPPSGSFTYAVVPAVVC